jgi:hypothetical protein
MTHIREHLKNTTKAVIAGDWHGNYSWVKNKAVYMCQRFGTDTIMQLGDFGFIPGTAEFTKLDNLLSKKGITVLFVDGNHEPFDTYRARPTVEDGFQQLGTNIVRIMRGTVFDLGGTHCLGLGGAGSIDRQYRIAGKDWFPDEYITGVDVEAAVANTLTLQQEGCRVDFMFTHDAPAGINIPMERIGYTPDPRVEAACNMNRILLGSVVNEVAPRVLFHGHYHTQYTSTYTTRRTQLNGVTTVDDVRVIGLTKDNTHEKGGHPGFWFLNTTLYQRNGTLAAKII